MSTLDDKILGEKLHYYCSSSSEEEDDDHNECTEEEKTASGPTMIVNVSAPENWQGYSTNTGPKGVIQDWQKYKQLETKFRVEQENEKLTLIKNVSLTCQSSLDEEKKHLEEDQLEEEMKELLEDKLLDEFVHKKMKEMMNTASRQPRFCCLEKLRNGEEFLDAIDKENSSVTAVIHIYEEENKNCKLMNACLEQLAKEYPKVKFCCIEARSAGMSKQFSQNGVPALLIYKGGSLIGNFVQISEELGDFFVAGDIENFLLEHGILPDHSLIPRIMRTRHLQKAISESD